MPGAPAVNNSLFRIKYEVIVLLATRVVAIAAIAKMTKAAVFPNLLLQEMRNLVSVVCRETCMADKAGGESAAGQQMIQEKVFHGSAGYASVLTNFVEGKGDGANMYSRIPIENNREGNGERSGSHMLRLLDTFSCDEGKLTGTQIEATSLLINLRFHDLSVGDTRKQLHS